MITISHQINTNENISLNLTKPGIYYKYCFFSFIFFNGLKSIVKKDFTSNNNANKRIINCCTTLIGCNNLNPILIAVRTQFP